MRKKLEKIIMTFCVIAFLVGMLSLEKGFNAFNITLLLVGGFPVILMLVMAIIAFFHDFEDDADGGDIMGELGVYFFIMLALALSFLFGFSITNNVVQFSAMLTVTIVIGVTIASTVVLTIVATLVVGVIDDVTERV